MGHSRSSLAPGQRRLALHTDLMRETVFRDLHALYPDRIVNKTNGGHLPTLALRRQSEAHRPPRRTVGPRDPRRRGRVRGPPSRGAWTPHSASRLRAIRREIKNRLAAEINRHLGVAIDPDALFDVQIKRIHEYKRQHLNILEAAALYRAIKDDPAASYAPRVKIFAGKAASSYVQAKLIIKLAYDLAGVVNADPAMRGRLAIAFMPNYNVSMAEIIIPAADLSEQISTAGMEASGTGNMKLALNGALTVGTLDGANVEIMEHVGPENITIFGLTAAEASARRREEGHARRALEASPRLTDTLDAIASGWLSPDDPSRFSGLVRGLQDSDHFLVTDDFEAYWTAQRELDRLWAEPDTWFAKSVANIAGVGWFSSDRTIREYAAEIWRAPLQ
jgi:starch phosphorylase